MDQIETTASPTIETKTSFWKLLCDSIKGVHHNYTEGPIGTSILMLAIPMVLEMSMESVFAVADVFFVGKLGPYAVATVGLTESLITLIYTVSVGLSIGATAMVARRVGERDPEGASVTAVQVLILGAMISVVLGIVGVIFAPKLLAMMGASEEVLQKGTSYARVMYGGNAVILLLFLSNAIFRGAGDGSIAMRSLWLANAINLVLAPSLIFGFGPFPELGVTGAAIATTVGRGIGAVYTITHLFQGKGRVKVRREHFKVSFELMKRIMKLSSSGMLQVFIGMASWIGLVRVISTFGNEALAGYTIGIRIVLFALFPSFGLGAAAATMVGQALGAKKPDRAERAVWMTGFYNMCFLGTVGLIFVLFAPWIVRLFSTDPQVQAYASTCLRTVACGFLFYAYGMVINQSFNGAGDTWTPTMLNFFVFWVFEIPTAYVLSKVLGYGPFGVFISITLAFSSLAIVSALLFRRGKWKLKHV